MLMEEFIERTGFEPTAEEYCEIEEDYYRSDEDKNTFCRRWLTDGGVNRMAKVRAEQIGTLRKQLAEMNVRLEEEAEKTARQLAELNRELDRELEWEPSESTGTCLAQESYEMLRQECERSGGILTITEAKEILHREFGFDTSIIQIIQEASAYEVNKYHRLRVKETYQREPLYDVSDYNYIRFDCVGHFYEMVNGELERYWC